jgi:predicted glycosyltransferase involved in capsule biosynthesis
MGDIKLKDIEFIAPVHIDNKERSTNINIQREFFNLLGIKILYIESGPVKVLFDSIFIKSKEFNKCKLYNLSVQHTNKKYVCFIDSDVLFDPKWAVVGINQNIDGLTVSYNRKCLYLKYNSKHLLKCEPSIEKCFKYCVPSNWKLDNTATDQIITQDLINASLKNKVFGDYSGCIVPNSNAIGGCLTMSVKTFNDICGFNPNFSGWGYEDNEILSRSKILRKNVSYISDPHALLFHLPHTDTIITTTESSSINHREIQKIESMSRVEMVNYIKTFKND